MPIVMLPIRYTVIKEIQDDLTFIMGLQSLSIPNLKYMFPRSFFTLTVFSTMARFLIDNFT